MSRDSSETAAPPTYKVVELSTVTDEAIERVLNEWVPKGWVFEGMQFAMRDSSKRPSMAFVLFTRLSPAHTSHPSQGAAVTDSM